MPHVITLCYDGDLQLTCLSCVILITCNRESVTVISKFTVVLILGRGRHTAAQLVCGEWVGLTAAEVESAAIWSGCVLCRVSVAPVVHYVQRGEGSL